MRDFHPLEAPDFSWRTNEIVEVLATPHLNVLPLRVLPSQIPKGQVTLFKVREAEHKIRIAMSALSRSALAVIPKSPNATEPSKTRHQINAAMYYSTHLRQPWVRQVGRDSLSTDFVVPPNLDERQLQSR